MEQRRVILEGSCNFRDLGGLINREGRMVKKGLLYRSDDLSNLSDDDVRVLEDMSIQYVIDYRGDKEVAKGADRLPDGCTYLHLDPNADVAALASSTNVDMVMDEEHAKQKMTEQYQQFVTSKQAQSVYRTTIQMMLKHEVPLLFHCRGGKDRTGFAAMLMYLLLDVPFETIMEDYLYTDICRQKRNLRRMEEYKKHIRDEVALAGLATLQKSDPAYLQAAYDTILQTYGTFANYRRIVLDIGDEDIINIKEYYLERKS